MADSVKYCGKVQEDEATEMAGVGGEEEIIGYFEASCFCAVLQTETRLKGFKQTGGVEVGQELHKPLLI